MDNVWDLVQEINVDLFPVYFEIFLSAYCSELYFYAIEVRIFIRKKMLKG